MNLFFLMCFHIKHNLYVKNWEKTVDQSIYIDFCVKLMIVSVNDVMNFSTEFMFQYSNEGLVCRAKNLDGLSSIFLRNVWTE